MGFYAYWITSPIYPFCNLKCSYCYNVWKRPGAESPAEIAVAIVGQFLQRWAPTLSPSVRVDQPERYAREWQELVQAYVDALRRTSTGSFRMTALCARCSQLALGQMRQLIPTSVTLGARCCASSAYPIAARCSMLQPMATTRRLSCE